MDQVLNEILAEIERAPSQVPQKQWLEMLRLLRPEPEHKDAVYSQLYQILDTNALAAPAYAKWIYALYYEADLKEALQVAEHADKRYPNSRDILVLFGMSLRKAGQTEKAIAKYEQVIALHPGKDFDAHYNLGNALLERDAVKAEENYRAAVSIKPGSAVAHYGLGLALQKQGRTGEALAELETARTLNPRDSDVCIALGNARLDSDPVAAERDYAEAANISGSATAYYNWGIALARNNKPAEAEEKYIRTTEIEGDYANAYYNLGVLLQNDRKRLEDAKLRYRQAIAADPNHSDAHFNLGLLLSDGGELDEAVAEYDAAAQANPDYADAYYNCAGILTRLERFRDAAERCAKAVSVCPPADSDRKAKIHYIWGLALENDEEIPERDQPVRAAEQYKNAVDADPAFADAFFALGNVCYKQEKEKDALANWEVAVKLQPDFAYAWHNIADLYHREGQYKLGWDTWQRAKAAYQSIASQNVATTEAEKPPRAYFFYVLGTMQQEVFRELDRAEESYRKACELSPQFTGPRCSLVRLYLEQAEQSVRRSDLSANTEDRFDQRSRFSTEAWRAYLDADALLEAEIDKATLKERKFKALLQRGELHLMMRDFDGAEKFLQQARDLNDSGPRVWTGLGVLYGRKENAAKAVENFEEALRRKPKDLGTRSNLANAYQARGWFDLAETEYRRVLNVTDGHIETHLGLGETYMSLAEAGDPEFYSKAIECFEAALGLGSKRRGSKLLGDREIAAIHFYLGMAKSKLLEKGSAEKSDTLLKSALENFQACHQKDPENYQAARARDKIKSQLCDPAPRLRRLAESYGPVLILIPCLAALLLVQISFFFKWPVRHLDPGYYATLSFGLLVFVIAALYLPQILKLEVGAVKLEKSLTEAAPKAPVVLGLKWKAQRLPVLEHHLSGQLPAPGEGKQAAGEKSTVKDLKT